MMSQLVCEVEVWSGEAVAVSIAERPRIRSTRLEGGAGAAVVAESDADRGGRVGCCTGSLSGRGCATADSVRTVHDLEAVHSLSRGYCECEVEVVTTVAVLSNRHRYAVRRL